MSESPNAAQPSTTPAAPSAAPADDQRYAQAAARVAELERVMSERASADAAADEARKKKLREEGDIKKLLEEREADLAKLQAKLSEIDGDAKLGRSYRERESARIEAAKAQLTPQQAALVDAMGSVDLKAQLLDQFIAAKTVAPTPKAAAPGGPPAPGVKTDWNAIGSREELERAKAGDPNGFAELVNGMFSRTRKSTTLDALFAPKNGA